MASSCARVAPSRACCDMPCSVDIADVVAFVAATDARWISGQNIDVTGGSRL